eukprot:scaffold4258_cov32-Tisochrysis_lutea.AAC.2
MAAIRSAVTPSSCAWVARVASIRSSAGLRAATFIPLGNRSSTSWTDPSRGAKPYSSKKRREE